VERRSTVAALVAALIAAAVTFGVVALWPPRAPRTTTTVRATPSVVTSVRTLARLESAQMHVERVIDLRDRQQALFGLVSAQDAILLVAAADVTAGVDLAQLRDDDVHADAARGTATIVLPPARVLSTELDERHTWVYARQTDVLAQRHEDLETRARQEAQRTLEQAALEAGLLARARTGAQHTVESLVRSLGYAHVTVTSRAE